MYMYIYFGNVVTPQISFIQVKGLSYLKEVSGNFFKLIPLAKPNPDHQPSRYRGHYVK